MAQFTRRAIMASFIKLVGHKPLDKITVRDIVEDCEITRNTFYYHFQDIYDLAAEVVRTELSAIVQRRGAGCDHWTLFQDVAEFAQANRGAVLHIYHSARRGELVRVLEAATDEYLLNLLERWPASADVPAPEKELLAHMLRYAMEGLAADWLEKGMRTPPQPLLESLRHLFDGVIPDSLARAAQTGGQK